MSCKKKLPEGVFTVRRSLCAACPTPCALQHHANFHSDVCASCPLPRRRWGHYGKCSQSEGQEKTRGLGDVVSSIAEPIARVSDAIFGTKIVGCGGCAKRKAALNALVPDISRPIGRKERD